MNVPQNHDYRGKHWFRYEVDTGSRRKGSGSLKQTKKLFFSDYFWLVATHIMPRLCYKYCSESLLCASCEFELEPELALKNTNSVTLVFVNCQLSVLTSNFAQGIL